MQTNQGLGGRSNRGDGRRLKILLIDPHDSDVRLIEECFRVLRIRDDVTVARSAEDALALLGNENHGPPDLILLDTSTADGFSLLDKLRHNPLLRTVPVVVLTTCSDEREVGRAYALGANAFVCKPMSDYFDVVSDLAQFWLKRVEYPTSE